MVHALVPVLSELYAPATHAVHALVPVNSALYEPAVHAVHAADVGVPETAP